MATIGVIDYGMGNLHSIAKALEHVSSDFRVEIQFDPDDLRKADRLVLPGVGGVRSCMNELVRLELDECIRECVREKPVLGICLGMQALFEYSEENNGVDALSVVSGRVIEFAPPAVESAGTARRKVPHMGWNQVRQARPHVLWQDVPDDSWFYFVHSFYAAPSNDDNVLGTTEYGQRFTSAVIADNVCAVQFHPEKSQRPGMQLLANFLRWDGEA